MQHINKAAFAMVCIRDGEGKRVLLVNIMDPQVHFP
jgi:hypothetical protein